MARARAQWPGVAPSDIYGAEHLLRLFGASGGVVVTHTVPLSTYKRVHVWIFFLVRLPVILAATGMSSAEAAGAASKLSEFLKYV